MSFAYIDSQGKEVPIPGPDALRLRIELGAITDSTQFYDAGSDRWGPASEHEIYRQLKRDIASSQSGGFAAPPPSMPPPDAPAASAGPASGAVEPDESPAEEVVEISSLAPDVHAFEPWDPDPSEVAGIEKDLDGIVAGGGDDDPSHDDLFYPQGATADELDAGMEGFTLADLDAPVIRDVGEPEAVEEEVGGRQSPEIGDDPFGVDEAGEDDGSGFDFGAGELQLDEEEAEDEPGPAPVEAGAGGVGDPAPFMAGVPAGGPPEAFEDDDTPDFGMAFEGGAPDDDFGDDLNLGVEGGGDVPGTESSPVGVAGMSPAAGEGPGGSEGSDGAQRSDDPYARTVRERRGPRSAPPARRGGGGGAGRLVAALFVIVVVAGGAWFITRGGDEGTATAQPVVTLPEIPAELEPRLAEVARIASGLMMAEFDSLPQRTALAPEPTERWLSGAYLAGASGYPAVEEYWEGVGALLDRMIASEDEVWASALEAALDSASVAQSAEQPLRDRALAGWAAAAPDRAAVHAELRGIVEASLELHAFLLRNEAAITFAPGTGGAAGDPFLEAVPDTPELRDTMWDLVGDITVALDALGYLQQVETESLMDRVQEKLVANGFR